MEALSQEGSDGKRRGARTRTQTKRLFDGSYDLSSKSQEVMIFVHQWSK